MVVAVVVIEQTQDDVAVDIMVSRDVLLDSLEYLCLLTPLPVEKPGQLHVRPAAP